jgi:ATP-dependent DNA ligase
VFARKDGSRVRVWARTTSDFTACFTRIRDAVAALPADTALIDGEAVLPRADGSFDFKGLRSRGGQAGAILVAYDVLEVDAQDMRPEGKRLTRLLRGKTVRGGIQLIEALAGDGAIFRHACAAMHAP